MLGRHFAAAGETARALRYYELAGDHATAPSPTTRRRPPFRPPWPIGEPAPAGRPPWRPPEADNAAADLLAKLANVLWRTGRRGQARDAFTEALRLARGGDSRSAGRTC